VSPAAGVICLFSDANDYIVAHSNDAMTALQKAHYSQTPLADINESFKAQKMFSSHDWKRLYSDGTVTNWLQQSTDFFMASAGIKDFTPASKYFDPSHYLKTIG
jgi:NitT/TauT family transport system substrate-binding protein